MFQTDCVRGSMSQSAMFRFRRNASELTVKDGRYICPGCNPEVGKVGSERPESEDKYQTKYALRVFFKGSVLSMKIETLLSVLNVYTIQ